MDFHEEPENVKIRLENISNDETADLLQSGTDDNCTDNSNLKQKSIEQGSEQALLSDLHHFEDLLLASTAQILNAFEQKIAYDATKQKQIDSLHAELQQHRTDLIARTNRPLVNGLIGLYDDIGKISKNLRKKSLEELDSERFFKAFESLKEDIEILLDQNGVISFIEQGEKFDPKRQHAVRQVKTLDNQLVGTIAERLRLGFEQGNDLIQKERVSVYTVDKTTLRQEDTTKTTNPDAVEPCDVEKKNDR